MQKEKQTQKKTNNLKVQLPGQKSHLDEA